MTIRSGFLAAAVLAAAALLAACESDKRATPGGGGGGGGSADDPVKQLRRDGRWLVDGHGRVVLAHGMNLVYKVAPFVPPDEPAGFTTADADWLAQHGFNTARIGVLWVGVTPESADAVDTAYLQAWDRVIGLLAARKIWMLFDFHQDMLSPRYQGEGVPEWAVDEIEGPTTTVLGPPMFGFPFNYFTPQVSEAFDNLWAENGAVWAGHRAAWVAVASRWRGQDYSMGYDLLNEPWAGMEWPTCIFPPMVGCPDADASEIQPFFENTIAGIREVDPDNLVWLEAQLLSGGTGSPPGFTPIEGEDQLGYSYHNYCPLNALFQSAQLGFPVPLPLPVESCESFEADVVAQARATAERIGAVELITEFGASDDLALIGRVTALADANLIGWQYWHYKNWSDPTTQSQATGAQGMFADDADLASVKTEKLKLLSRPYPQSTAGIPVALSFDPASGAFEYRYTPRAATANTELFVPVALHYPDGYALDVTGATLVSTPGASLVELRNDAAATEVVVHITRGG